jgi:hypothetical protein
MRERADLLLPTAPERAVTLLEKACEKDPSNYAVYESLCTAYKLLHNHVAFKTVMRTRVAVLDTCDSAGSAEYASLLQDAGSDEELATAICEKIRQSVSWLASDACFPNLVNVLVEHRCNSEACMSIEALATVAKSTETLCWILDIVVANPALRATFAEAISSVAARTSLFSPKLFDALVRCGWTLEIRILIEKIPHSRFTSGDIRTIVATIGQNSELKCAVSKLVVEHLATSNQFDWELFADLVKLGWKEELLQAIRRAQPRTINPQSLRGLIPLVGTDQALRIAITTSLVAQTGESDLQVFKEFIRAGWKDEAINLARTYPEGSYSPPWFLRTCYVCARGRSRSRKSQSKLRGSHLQRDKQQGTHT